MRVTEKKNNGASLPQIQTTTRRRGAGIILAILGILFLLGTGAAQPAQAGTTTLTFDEFTTGTIVTTQYQSLGVTISGAQTYIACPTCGSLFPPVSGSTEVYSPTGSMTFTFDSSIIGGDVQTVSAYVTDYNGPAGIYAYDSSGNLLGQSVMPAAGVNVFLSFTSPGNPIAYVTIHDGGGQFTVDNFSFTWGPSAFSVLHSFNGTDGFSPQKELAMDTQGNLIGATYAGGNYGAGLVFQMNSSGTENVLYNFIGAADGAYPHARMVADSTGNLYGTTVYGGASGHGVAFKLDSSGKETVLHSFSYSGTDGAYPEAGLIMDKAGNLYGTNLYGGTGGSGTVFRLDPSGNETVLYSFKGGVDGGVPFAGLTMDSAGNLYDTTVNGGDYGDGTVFELVRNSDGSYKEKVLYSFKGGDSDGSSPYAGLVMDTSGNLYGATQNDGLHGYGIVFKLDTSSGNEIVLHNFAGGTDDGAYPAGPLVIDAAGNLYGTTPHGGASDEGTIFELVNSSGTYTETVLHSFANSDGTNPGAGLLIDAAGNLYGAAQNGGTYGAGTVFKLTTATTPQQASGDMIGYVNDLLSEGVIKNGQDNSLVKELQKAIDMMNAGKINGAIGNLESFITEVNDLSSSGILSPAQAGALVSAANSVTTQLQTS